MKSGKEEIYSVKVKHSAQERFDKRYGKTCGKIKTAIKITVCRKSMFFQKKCLFSIPNPKPLPRGKGLYYWGYRPVQARTLAVSRTKSLHDAVTQMADDLYGGSAPKQGRFGCLPKVLHDAKPT